MRLRKQELHTCTRYSLGAACFRTRGEFLEIEFENAYIVLEPRTLVVEAPIASHREAVDERRKRVIVEFREEIKPLTPNRIDFVGHATLGLFEVRITDLDFDTYITIVTPGGHYYDYVVVSKRLLYVEMSAKKKTYYEEEPNKKLILYIV